MKFKVYDSYSTVFLNAAYATTTTVIHTIQEE